MLPPPTTDVVDFVLRPSDCSSRAEAEQRCRLPIKLPERPPLPSRRLQYSLGELMIVMVGLSISLAGGRWMPPDIFAAVLGITTLLGLFFVTWHPPESRAGKLIWAALIIAYLMAVVAAALRLPANG
jgi:hypothetical protein